VLQWAREHDCPWDEETCAQAAESGHLEMLKWARMHGCPWDAHTCACAASSGHLEVLRWVQANDATGVAWDEYRVRAYADGPRMQEVLTWLDELSAP